MATPNTVSDKIPASASASNGAGAQTSTSLLDTAPVASTGDWLDLAGFLCAGVCGVGTLIMLAGFFFASEDNIWPLLVGGGLVSLSGLGWGILGLTMIVSIVKRWLTVPRKARR